MFVIWYVLKTQAEGVKLRNGKRLSYNLNAHLAFWLSLLVMGHGCPKFDDKGRVSSNRGGWQGRELAPSIRYCTRKAV